jgi:hypothetical protein
MVRLKISDCFHMRFITNTCLALFARVNKDLGLRLQNATEAAVAGH